MKKQKSRTIAFRVVEADYLRFQAVAAAAGMQIGDWCRSRLSAVLDGPSLNANEQLLFTELARLRYVVGIGFGLIAEQRLARDEWGQVLQVADQQGGAIARRLIEQQKQKTN